MTHHQKIKTLLTLAILLTLVLWTNELYARAGGGGGTGKGKGIVSIIAIICWAIYTAIITSVLFFKTRRTKGIILLASEHDNLWDMHALKMHAKSMFYKMQDAWMGKNIDAVRELITDQLYADYKQQLDYMRLKNETNVLEGIQINDVRIISCQDFNEDAKDSYIAYIKGTIVDYTRAERSGNIIINKERDEEKFSDTYHFVRYGNKWLLHYIDNDVSISDLISARNYREK